MAFAIKSSGLGRILEGDVPVTLVKNADVAINESEFIAITGPSGSGKSSLLYLLGLLDKPSEGEVFINGNNVSEYSDEKLAEVRLKEIGFVFQFHFLLPEFTAKENVMLPMQRLGKLNNIEMAERAEELLIQFGLKDQMNKIPRKLSGGQAQRVAISRALANNPKIILADEPTGNLDTVSSNVVQNILSDLARKMGRAVVIVTHDESFAKNADRIIHIVDGKIV
jgi:lipoprotein-releasing system ATP-binding protein